MRAVMFQTDPPSRSIGGALPTDSILNREEPDNVILGTSGLGFVVARSRSRPILLRVRLGARSPLTPSSIAKSPITSSSACLARVLLWCVALRWSGGLGAVVDWFSFSICVPRLGGRCPLTAVTVLEISDMRTKRL